MKNKEKTHNGDLFRYGQYERSGSDYWLTPVDLLERIKAQYSPNGELFDPCPRNPTFDGLMMDDWPLDQWIYVNPPYSQISDWSKKCFVESQKGARIILLIPARTCTKYFHQWIYNHSEIIFIKGRLKYLNPVSGVSKGSAPFPSILCVYNGNVKYGGI